MSCNTFVPIMDLVREVEALLAARYIDKDDPRITDGVFTSPTIRGDLILDAAAKEVFCGLVQACGLEAPFGKMWMPRPLNPNYSPVSYSTPDGSIEVRWVPIPKPIPQPTEPGMLPVSYDAGGNTEVRWETVYDILAAASGATGNVKSVAQLLLIQDPTDNTVITVESYHEGMRRGGGIFVYNSQNLDTYDGGVSLGKWRRIFSVLTPYDFGVIGDFSRATIGDKFLTVADARAIYTNATELTELYDRVAFDSFLLYIIANRCDDVNWGCQLLIDRPLVSYRLAKTLLVYGDLIVRGIDKFTPYVLHIATFRFVAEGRVEIQGTPTIASDMTTRNIKNGVVFGTVPKLGLTGEASGCMFDAIIGDKLLGYACYFGTSVHFTKVGQVRAAYCGSALKHSDGNNKRLQGLVDDFVSVTPNGLTTFSQRDVLSIPNMALTENMVDDYTITCHINSEPYVIHAIDFVNKTISIFPSLPAGITAGEVLYTFGGAVFQNSNNTACTTVDTVQAIVSGAGVKLPSLYGINVGSLITEYCGAGIIINTTNGTHRGSVVTQGYFEANRADILHMWGTAQAACLSILSSIALNPKRIWNLQAYRYTDGTRREQYSVMPYGNVNLYGALVNAEPPRGAIHLTTHSTVSYAVNPTLQLSYDTDIAILTGRDSKTLFYYGTGTSVLTIVPPVGMTINGSDASIVVPLGQYKGAVTVTLYVPLKTGVTDVTVTITGQRIISSGTTAQRPTTPEIGQIYYDKTLLSAGKPITWNGLIWVGSDGANADTANSGITASRPTNVAVGYQYFDTTLGKPVYFKSTGVWVDANGTTV